MHTREINAEDAPKPGGPYSQAVEVSGGNRILFLSGQLGTEADGTVPSSMEEQARLAWRNVGGSWRRRAWGSATW